jgi:hypothetical protein
MEMYNVTLLVIDFSIKGGSDHECIYGYLHRLIDYLYACGYGYEI